MDNNAGLCGTVNVVFARTIHTLNCNDIFYNLFAR